MVKFYKLRVLNKNNKTGDTWGISLPTKKIDGLQNCNFSITRSGTALILESGASFKNNSFEGFQ